MLMSAFVTEGVRIAAKVMPEMKEEIVIRKPRPKRLKVMKQRQPFYPESKLHKMANFYRPKESQ